MTQAQALAIMKTGVNVYLSGSAGSGKTYTLNQYIDWLRSHDITVATTASTGIAATHMNGMTIHGFAGIGIRERLTEEDIDALLQKPYLAKRFDKTKVLIIDEVSMLHARTLDMVDMVCRAFKRVDAPFGGIQVILSGDFFQLPPISKGENNGTNDMVFNAESWKDMKPAICYLTEQHRQDDDRFMGILNAMRTSTVTEEHLGPIRARLDAMVATDTVPTKLYTHNVDVDAINQMELDKLDGAEKMYQMTSSGRDVLVEILKKSCIAPETLRLKTGAEVMFIKNNFEKGYVNGTRGKIESFQNDGTPVVRLYNGWQVIVPYETWAIEEDGKQKAGLTQLPLRLAWAITIHKSQGMSLDHAEIDLGKTFAYGMGYVALSRVRTLSGIRLVGFNENALRMDPAVLELDQELQSESEDNEALFGKLSKDEQQKLETAFIIRSEGTLKADGPKKSKEKIPTYMVTKAMLDEQKTILEIATERKFTFGTIIHHIEQVLEHHPDINLKHIRPSEAEIKAVKKHFKKAEGKLSPIKSALEKEGNRMSFDQIRLARLFVK